MSKEADMFESVKKVLQDQLGCNEIYAEVGNIDVVAFKEQVSIIVEMKKNLNFKVIEQAIRAKYYADYIFVAVPKPKTAHSKVAINLLKSEGIGLIYVTGKVYNKATIHFIGRVNHQKRYNLRKRIKPEFHSRTVGGVKTGEGITEYQEMITKIKDKLQEINDWVAVNDLLEFAQTVYKKPKKSLAITLGQPWNRHWCEVKTEKRVTYVRYNETGEAPIKTRTKRKRNTKKTTKKQKGEMKNEHTPKLAIPLP